MKILQKAGSILSTTFIILLVFLAYGSVENRWYRVITIDGNSMSPTLWYGDLIVITPPRGNIPVDTIVVMGLDGNLVTHRLIDYDNNGRPVTKGDANDVPDSFSNPDIQIVGIYRMRVPGLGYPFLFLRGLMN